MTERRAPAESWVALHEEILHELRRARDELSKLGRNRDTCPNKKMWVQFIIRILGKRERMVF